MDLSQADRPAQHRWPPPIGERPGWNKRLVFPEEEALSCLVAIPPEHLLLWSEGLGVGLQLLLAAEAHSGALALQRQLPPASLAAYASSL